MKKLSAIAMGFGMILSGMPAVVSAVSTVYVEHSSEQQFKKGDPNQVVINSQGNIFLARQVETWLGKGTEEWVVNALVWDGQDRLYVATSGKGYIYQIEKGKKPKIVYGEKPDDQRHVFSLALDLQGRLLAGTGGEKASLLRIDKNGRIKTLLSDEKIKYIWSIVVGPAGRIYLGTGPVGEVLTLDAQGKNRQILYKAKEKNILALALAKDGILYAGGDQYGLVYRIDPSSKKTTIAYDTQHSEIGALVFDEKGNLYVSTADAGAARPGAKLILSDGDTSRSEAAVKKSQSEKADTKSDKDKNKKGDQAKPTNKVTPPATSKKITGKRAASPSAGRPTKVNDIYRISPAGYVTKLFSKAVVILSMAYKGDGELLLGTGNEGKLLLLNVETEEAVVLHTAKPSAQISAVTVTEKGVVLAGCANPAKLIAVKPNYVRRGLYLSDVVDARQISQWGKMQIEAEIPDAARVEVSTRSGNTSDPVKGGWRNWSNFSAASEDIVVGSDRGRFLQYKILLQTADDQITPTVRQVRVAHMIPNLPPRVQDLKVGRSGGDTRSAKQQPARSSRTLSISWKAADENGDKLTHEIFIRQIGNTRWVRIAKDLAVPNYKWNSLTVSDGRYEVKVVTSDKNSNPEGKELADSRVSEAVIIDNTPPEVSELGYELSDNQVSVQAEVKDELSVIKGVNYVIDSGEKWRIALPVDGVFDSRCEKVKFNIDIEKSGEHLIALRFEDELGNVTYRNLSILVPEKKEL